MSRRSLSTLLLLVAVAFTCSAAISVEESDIVVDNNNNHVINNHNDNDNVDDMLISGESGFSMHDLIKASKKALSSGAFRNLRDNNFSRKSFASLSRTNQVKLLKYLPRRDKEYFMDKLKVDKRYKGIVKSGFNPEPADRNIINRNLDTRRGRRDERLANDAAKNGDVVKVLFTKDVSHVNPFKDAYAAPAGPNEGPSRKIGAFIPPSDVTSKGQPSDSAAGDAMDAVATKCDPLLNPACKHSVPQPGQAGFRANSDPDSIRNAKKYHTALRPATADSVRRAPDASALAGNAVDPYSQTGHAAVRAHKNMMVSRYAADTLERRRRLGFDPSKERNDLPWDKTGPTGDETAAMGDPLPEIRELNLRSKKAKALRRTRDEGAKIDAKRATEIDPYARAAAALRPIESGNAHIDPRFGPGSKAAESSKSMGWQESIPDDSRKAYIPRMDTATRGQSAPVNAVADESDPLPHPADSRVAQPMYMQYPRGIQSNRVDGGAAAHPHRNVHRDTKLIGGRSGKKDNNDDGNGDDNKAETEAVYAQKSEFQVGPMSYKNAPLPPPIPGPGDPGSPQEAQRKIALKHDFEGIAPLTPQQEKDAADARRKEKLRKKINVGDEQGVAVSPPKHG